MKPRLVGINHVTLEVESLERALDFYGRLFDLRYRSRSSTAAFIDIGDQFLALMQTGARGRERDAAGHFGLVVDDKDAARAALSRARATVMPGRRLDFLDPDGNRVEIVQYDQIQFTKTPEILHAMGLTLDKSEQALAELRPKKLTT